MKVRREFDMLFLKLFTDVFRLCIFLVPARLSLLRSGNKSGTVGCAPVTRCPAQYAGLCRDRFALLHGAKGGFINVILRRKHAFYQTKL
jgi:hypothetical protein